MKSREEMNAYFNEHNKARIKYLKSQKRCQICGKKDHRTLDGFIHCVECNEKNKVRQRERYARRKGLKINDR